MNDQKDQSSEQTKKFKSSAGIDWENIMMRKLMQDLPTLEIH